MVRIRLRRVGAKKKPSYRVVVTDQRTSRDGRLIENIGYFDARTQPETVEINHERAAYWLSVGAQPSTAVARLLARIGRLDSQGKPIPYVAEPETAAQSSEGNGHPA